MLYVILGIMAICLLITVLFISHQNNVIERLKGSSFQTKELIFSMEEYLQIINELSYQNDVLTDTNEKLNEKIAASFWKGVTQTAALYQWANDKNYWWADVDLQTRSIYGCEGDQIIDIGYVGFDKFVIQDKEYKQHLGKALNNGRH